MNKNSKKKQQLKREIALSQFKIQKYRKKTGSCKQFEKNKWLYLL